MPGVQAAMDARRSIFVIAKRFQIAQHELCLALCGGLAIEAALLLSCLDAIVSGPWDTTRDAFYEGLLATVFDLESHNSVHNLHCRLKRHVVINPARVDQKSSELPQNHMINFVGIIRQESGKNHHKRVWGSVLSCQPCRVDARLLGREVDSNAARVAVICESD
jgi:hypothetical protein